MFEVKYVHKYLDESYFMTEVNHRNKLNVFQLTSVMSLYRKQSKM